MNFIFEIIFILWGLLIVNNKAMKFSFLYVVAILTFIISPCFTNPVSSGEWGRKLNYRVMQDPQFLEALIPCCRDIRVGTVPMNVMQKNLKTVNQGASSGTVLAMPIQTTRDESAQNCACESREKVAWFQFFKLLVFVGFPGVFCVFCLYLTWIGQFYDLIPSKWLEVLHVPKWIWDN